MPRDDSPEGVGYKRPPEHSRFRKGQSGNPSGRRKAKSRLGLIEELDKLLNTPIKVARNGRYESISFIAALLNTTAEAALKGDAKARQTMLAFISEREQTIAQELKERESAQKAAAIDFFIEALTEEMSGNP